MLDAERLGDRQLHVVDVAVAPDRLEDRVREPQGVDVLHRLLAQVVVDPVDLRLLEPAVDGAGQLARRLQVVAERLLDHDPHAGRAAVELGVAHPAHDHGEEAGRGRQVEHVMRSAAHVLVEGRQTQGEVVEVLVVVEPARLVVDHLGEGGPEPVVDRRPRVGLDRRPREPAERGVVHLGARVADQRELRRQQAALRQVVDRRQQLPLREVAGRPEDGEQRGLGRPTHAQPGAQRVLGVGLRQRRAPPQTPPAPRSSRAASRTTRRTP